MHGKIWLLAIVIALFTEPLQQQRDVAWKKCWHCSGVGIQVDSLAVTLNETGDSPGEFDKPAC